MASILLDSNMPFTKIMIWRSQICDCLSLLFKNISYQPGDMSHNQENKTCIHVCFGSFVVCCFSTSSSYNREKFEVYHQNFRLGREVIFAKDQLSSSPAWGHPEIPKSRRIMRSFWVLKNNHSAGAEHWSSVKCSNVFKNPQVGRKIVRMVDGFFGHPKLIDLCVSFFLSHSMNPISKLKFWASSFLFD